MAIERAELIDRLGNRRAQGDQSGGGGHDEEEHRAERRGVLRAEPPPIARTGEARERREEDGRGGEGEDAVRQQKERVTVLEAGDAPLTEAGGEVRHDDEVEGEDRLPEHPRNEERADLPHPRHAERDDGVVMHHAGEGGQLREEVADRTDHDAVCQPLHAIARREDERAEDDAEVVRDGRERGPEESVLRVEDAHRRAAEAEKERLEEQNARQIVARCLLRGGQAGRDDRADEWPGEEEADRGERGERVEGGIEDAARQHPRGGLFVPFEEAGEDGDEGRAERAGGDDEEEEIRDAEGGVVGVEIGARAELPRDDHIPQQAEHPVGDEGEPDDRHRPAHRRARLPRPVGRDRHGAGAVDGGCGALDGGRAAMIGIGSSGGISSGIGMPGGAPRRTAAGQ